VIFCLVRNGRAGEDLELGDVVVKGVDGKYRRASSELPQAPALPFAADPTTGRGSIELPQDSKP
jgi:hypothetical protein